MAEVECVARREALRCIVPLTYEALGRLLQLPEGAEIAVINHPARRRLELHVRGYGYLVAEACSIPQISPAIGEINSEKLPGVIGVNWPKLPETE